MRIQISISMKWWVRDSKTGHSDAERLTARLRFLATVATLDFTFLDLSAAIKNKTKQQQQQKTPPPFLS